MTTPFALTRAQSHLVRRSFGALTRNPGTFIRLFYDRLFELDPTLRPPLGRNMETAHSTLMHTLALLSTATDHPDRLVFYSQDLGTRMQRIGISQQQFEIAGEALVWAVEHTLTDRCTPAVREAWQALIDLVNSVALREGSSIRLR